MRATLALLSLLHVAAAFDEGDAMPGGSGFGKAPQMATPDKPDKVEVQTGDGEVQKIEDLSNEQAAMIGLAPSSSEWGDEWPQKPETATHSSRGHPSRVSVPGLG